MSQLLNGLEAIVQYLYLGFAEIGAVIDRAFQVLGAIPSWIGSFLPAPVASAVLVCCTCQVVFWILGRGE